MKVRKRYTHPGFLDVVMEVRVITTRSFAWVYFYNTRGLFIGACSIRIPIDLSLWKEI